jgi:hypothetical protein
VNEDDAAQIPAPVHPAHKQRFFTGIGRAQPSTGMRAAKIAKEVEFHFCHLRI